MSVVNAGLMLSAPSGYTIDRSLRFRSSASAYLSRSFGNNGARKICTYSAWVKRGTLNDASTLLSCPYSGTQEGSVIAFSGDALRISHRAYSTGAQGAVISLLSTTQVFRDPSAWYHIVHVFDSTNATASDRSRLYVNGVRVTAFSSATYPSLNAFTYMGSQYTQFVGYNTNSVGYLDGYLTEINFIDGQALDPTSFGEYNEDTGVWQPIKYTGTYGTNGFYLNFRDNSTTTTLGYDYSGNSNNWTANNISVTSGVTYDSMTDVPTLTSEDAANYCTLNPIAALSGITIATLSNANLKHTGTSGLNRFSFGTFYVSSGKWYWEVTRTTAVTTYSYVGVRGSGSASYYAANGNIAKEGGTPTTYSSYGAGDIIGIAFDADNNTLEFFKNNTSQVELTGLTDELITPFLYSGSTDVWDANFGQRPFAYTPPAGFKSLNTYNLPDSTIEDGSKHFDIVTRAGTGSAYSVSSLSFAPDLVWFKSRSTTYDNNLQDRLRGTNQTLASNNTDEEKTRAGSVTSFDSNGYTGGSFVGLNASGQTYVDWMWKANGAGVSNTDGSITSTVSANTTAGFSIVTYTGTGSVETVGHGLGVAPKMVIIKNRDNAANWHVLTTAVDGSLDVLYLDLTNAKIDAAISSPTSDVFSIGTGNTIGASGYDYVAYCFADVEGYSKFGSYTGNGSADGPFVYTGFRPAFVLVKATSIANQPWYILDSTRDLQNISTNAELYPNSASAEVNLYKELDFLSNGFKVKSTGTGMNSSGNKYIYMALAENPFKNALAR